ncbi:MULTISPECIES: Cdc6/Cdc18 family protein [unclassified Haloferax]|uniref:Cdc6/Cdc18 family protein n=1 Tax=unclassified Haloferax TaxID=2625095 RepID=UPI000E265D28|nr:MULTISPECIES: Cdc6/Cdc18 family protein [unclassified Haloferax]RDZ32068.1 AAA family ATPase [Haloferax sp. Atlit-24N]RLM33264.1 AAA family ATPase [Haloferax sp. Atlit-109R]RLM40698.1 AAA family ATPase [Haloferax sp. Atlit-105R]
MIRDARVLRAGFVPREIEHRDAEVNHLSSVLEPITNGEPADTAIVTGPSGAGKTCISKFVTERLREEVLDVETTYVNCWRNYTRFRTLYQILDDLGATIDIHRQSTPHDELVDRLQQHDGPRTVVILDEVDQLEDPSVIYDLHSLPQFAIICIANKEEELFGRVDDRLVSRLRSSEHVRMDKYHDEQLYDILSARAKWGLDENVITDDQLYRIADAAAGDARLAIGILRTAAGKADRENLERITDNILLDAAEDARAQIKQKSLDSLTPHQRVVYDIVREHGPVGPSEIHERYSEEVDNPRTKRTVRAYLSKMTQYNLLEADGSSRDREYTAIDQPSPTLAE